MAMARKRFLNSFQSILLVLIKSMDPLIAMVARCSAIWVAQSGYP